MFLYSFRLELKMQEVECCCKTVPPLASSPSSPVLFVWLWLEIVNYWRKISRLLFQNKSWLDIERVIWNMIFYSIHPLNLILCLSFFVSFHLDKIQICVKVPLDRPQVTLEILIEMECPLRMFMFLYSIFLSQITDTDNLFWMQISPIIPLIGWK